MMPDGTKQEFPSRQRAVHSREIGGPGIPTFVDEPLPHPDWRFMAVLGGYRALPKGR